jgi:hypothetical protein
LVGALCQQTVPRWSTPPPPTAWRETPFYTDRERAALAWTEVVRIHTLDEDYEAARQ